MADKKKQNDYSAYQEYVNKRNNITPEQYMEYAVNRQGIGQRMAEKRVNNLNNILSNDYLANLGNGQYKTPLQTYQTKRMARDAWLAYDSAAEYLRAVYGRDAASGLNSYARYIKQLNDAAKSEASFYGQFAGKQDYNERYAYPQTVKGKTDAEIEAMIGAVPKAQNLLNRAAAFGKGTGSSGDDAYQKWLTDYFNNHTVTGLDRQIADNQSLLDANKAKQEEIKNRVYTGQSTPEINAAKVTRDYWANMAPSGQMIRADRADQVKYDTQQQLYNVYTAAMTGAPMSEEERKLFDAYVANSPEWQKYQASIDANKAVQEQYQQTKDSIGETMMGLNAQKKMTYADFVNMLSENNSPLIARVNAANQAMQDAEGAIAGFDAEYDEFRAGLDEVEETGDTSKLYADLDYADRNKAAYDQLVAGKKTAKEEFDAANKAVEEAYREYIASAENQYDSSWLEYLNAYNMIDNMKGYQGTLENEQYAAAMPNKPEKVGKTRAEQLEETIRQQLAMAEGRLDNLLSTAAGDWEAKNSQELYNLTSEQEKLDAQIAVLNAKREEVVVRSKYNELASAPDFSAKSAYDSENKDGLYQYINAKGTSQEQGAAPVFGMGEFASAVDVSAANDEASYQAAGYTFLLPDEVQAYNYIYATEGQDKAKEFLNSFVNIRNLRARSKESEEWAKYADEHGVWASVVSLGTNLAAGLVYPIQLADAAFNPNHSQFSDLYTANYATQAIRGTVGQNVAEWAGHDLGNTVYQTLMSLGDFGVALAAGKGAGALAGSGFARGLTQFIMSSEAGSSALLNNLQRGLSADKAVGMSVASAMIEALTEKYSIDALLKEPKKAALYIAKNMLTEGSEEAASNLANTLVDLIVNADQAELAQAIAEKGYAQALTEYAQSVGMDAIMGAISGGVMSGGNAAVNKGVQSYHTKQTGKQINTNQTYKQLHDIAVAMPEGSKARKIASGKEKLNNRKAGQLYNALMEELDAKSQTSVRKSMVTDIKGRLQELGAQGDTTQVAEAIQKAWMGEKLSARESDLIAQSKLAMQVQHELLDLEEGWAEKAHETASKQRRETLTQMLDVERLASKGYKPAQDDAAAKAIAKNASTTYANADQEKGLNTTAYTKEGTTVEIKRIEEQDGKAVYLVEKDGQDVTYAINDLELDSVNTENLVQPLKHGKMSVQAANTMMQLYATSGLSAPLYAKGFMVAYNAGVQRIGMAYVNNNSYSKALSPEVRKAAFDAGMADTKDEAPTVTKRKGRVTMDKSIDKANLTDNQKASIRAMEKLAKALHIDIEFFASKADATGSYAAYENGSFRDGVMRLDINAGRDNSTDVTEFAILRTASHELTHYIAESSPKMYRELQAFVVDHLLEKGQSLQTLMDRKKARESREMSDEAALEEVIADACEMMLKDSTAIETLARENATLFEKMADWLRDFFDKIREAFAGVEAVHAEARALMEADADGVIRYIDGLQALWDKALVDAARNVQGAQEAQGDARSAHDNVRYALREYSAQQKKNWESSKRIVIYTGPESLDLFVEKAINDKTNNSKIYFGKIPKELAERIMDDTGVATEDFNLSLGANEVRKIFDDHGNAKKEELRGQRAIVADDFHAIIEVVTSPDDIRLSPKLYNGRPAVMFEKTINGKRTIVTYQSAKHFDLAVQTMYVGKQKESLSAPTDELASVNTPEASSGTASDDSISQDLQSGNKKFSSREVSDLDAEYSRLYDEYRAAQVELREAERNYNEAADSPELMDAMTALINFDGSRFSPEGRTKYRELRAAVKQVEEKLRLGELSEQKEAAAEKVKQIKAEMDEVDRRAALLKEQEAIKKSGLSEEDYFRKQAVKEFGYTSYFVDAGYLLPNGKMLNFSGEKGKHFGTRGQDHRAIGIVFENTTGSAAMTRFMAGGNIRIMAESPGIDFINNTEPTTEQYAKIKSMVREYAEQRRFNVDISDENGRVIGSLFYEGKVNADKVVNDIKHYFATGEVREQSALDAFRYQARDADTISSREALANALETAAKNDLERGLLADYKKIIQSLNEDQEKLAGHQKIIRELSFKKGGLSQQEKDELAMAKNRAEIVRNRLNRNDKKLLKLEATEALKAVVARERVVAERNIRKEKDKQLAEYRERTRDTLTRSALRDRIRHDVKALNRLLLNETDTKHVPEELKGAVAQFLTVFTQDTSVFDQKKLDDLRYAYGKISDRNAANEDLPDISAQYDWDIANMMDDLREILPGRRLSELTQEETRKIRDIVQHFKFIVKESSRLFFFDKSRDIASTGQRFIEDTDQQKKYNGPDGAVANMLRGGMITPSYFFKKLGGVAKELFDDLKQGESTYGLRVAQARKFFDDVAEKYHYDDWRNVKDDVLTLNTQQGHEVVLTREQALGLYATWNRENSENGQNASHLSEGGFVYEEAMKKDKKTGKIEVDTSKPHKMTDKDMQQVVNWLTDEQRAYADAMVEYMSKDMAKLGNEVSMKLFGIEKYGEEKYYPYQTSKNYRYTALGAAAATNDQRLKHSSFTHRVTQFANNPIIAADFTTVWANHVNHMLLYSSMCVPLENFNRVYNYKYTDEDGNHSVKQSLINAYGSSAQKYIEQLMHDLNGGVAVQSDGVMDQLISKFKKNAVYASASVALQQPSAMVRAMALVNPKYFASGVMKDGSWDELTRYSGVAVIKEMGGFDTSTGFGAQDWITGERRKTKLETFSKKADDIASLLPERADRLAWVAIWKAVKAEVADNTGLEGEELMQAAAKRFDEVIGYTQVYDSTLSKSQMMRNKHLNAVTAFMAEPTVTYNLLVDAFFNRGKTDSVNPARAVAAFTATAIVNAMLKSLVTAARDDEEKNYLEKYAGEFVENVTSDLNPLNLIPYARDIVSIMQGYDVERADMSLISDLYKGVKRGVESAKDGDWYTMTKEFAGPISGLVGLPVKNVWRDIEAVFNAIHSIGTPMTPGGMKYSILEALPFYGSTPTDYYSRRLDAMLEGDAPELESLTMHLETGLGKAAKTVKSKTKEELGKRYKTGKIGDAEATDILMDYFDMDADEAYWQLKEWREKEAHKDEDDYSFSRTDDLKEALLSGKTAQIEAAKTELAGVGGYTDKEVVSKAKSAIKSLYVDGQITLDKAMKLLQEQTGAMDKNELYWLEQEWAYDKANPDGEWNKYMKVHEAIETGKGAKEAAKELLAHGVEKGDAAKVIANKWKEIYVTLYKTDRKAALDLHARILDAYVALGYTRSYQAKYIKDHWFE